MKSNWRSWIAFWKRCRVADDAGASTLEFAFSAVMLFTTVMGIMLVSLALYAHNEISEAARIGSRYAMVHGNSCSVNGSSCTASSATIQTYLQSQNFPGLVSANLNATATYSAYPSSGTCSPNVNCENPGNLVTVKVTYSYPFNIPLVETSTLSMSSSSSMVISN